MIRLSSPYSGSSEAADWSSSSCPSSMSCITTAAVIVLDTDAKEKAVPVVIGSRFATSARPATPAHARPSSQTMATDTPGIPVFLRHASTAFWRRVLGTPARGSTGTGVGDGVADGGGVTLAVGAGVGAGESVGAVVGDWLGASVAPAIATLSGLRSVVPNTPASARTRAAPATAAIPMPARVRRAPAAPEPAPPGVGALEPASADPPPGGIPPPRGRAWGSRAPRVRSVGSFGMMVRR